MSNAQLVEYLNQSLVETLISTDALAERYINHLVIADTNHHVALSLFDGLDGAYSSDRCQDTVAR